METKNKKNGNIPNLRFKGFEGEWKKYKISDFLDFFSTNSLSWEQLDYESKNIYNLHYGLIHKGLPTQIDLNISTLPSIISEFEPKNYFLCKDGDVSFADASEDTNDVAKVVEFYNCGNKKIVCGLHTIHGRDKLKLTVVGFKGYAFSSDVFRNQMKKLAQGTKVFSISQKNFNECHIGIPSKEEQIKVSSLLLLIDERIATQMKTIESLESLMCGAREKIFSQKLRFKDKNGDEFPEWNSAYLSDVLVKNSLKNKDLKYSQVQSVSNKLGFVNQENIFENRRVASLDTSNYYVIEKGVFAYNPSRIDVGSLAYKSDDEVSVISPLYISFRANKNYLVDNYLLNWFSSRDFIFQMNNSFEGSVRNTLSYDNLSKMIISTPSLPEQQKIADFLSIINRKIETEKAVLTQYQNQKKFLLQNLFI